jgi:hypothetical protein
MNFFKCRATQVNTGECMGEVLINLDQVAAYDPATMCVFVGGLRLFVDHPSATRLKKLLEDRFASFQRVQPDPLTESEFYPFKEIPMHKLCTVMPESLYGRLVKWGIKTT